MIKFYSPLRYPGGKGKIAIFFANFIQENGMSGCTYIEPYVGGASVALYLMMNKFVNNIIINDKDRSIYAFWYSVLYETDNLCDKILKTDVTVDNWKIQKDIQSDKHNVDLLTLGFSTFFLNRTNRSGILKGGIIGGKNQEGNFLINARFNKENLIKRIKDISHYRDYISLYNMDAVDLVHQLKNSLDDNSFFYFDPPYYVKGKGLYMNYYNDNDHSNICNEISSISRQKWIVTYDTAPFIYKLYSKFRIKEYCLNYCASVKSKGKEYMIFSDNSVLPKAKEFIS